MIYFATTSSPAIREAMAAGLLGCIETPNGGSRHPAGSAWCADNGCYGASYTGDDAWWEWLTARAADAGDCSFAVAPDVVADAAATLERSTPWLPRIRDLGYPAAFVAQDGADQTPPPWGHFDVLFLGGSTEWKLGPVARALTLEAHDREVPVHMGRVNSERRFAYALALGCSSVDGTYLAYGPTLNLPAVLAWVRLVDQPSLL